MIVVMKPDQWFTLWMTLIQAFGGGLLTLGGVALGFLFAKRQDKQKRWQEDITFWLDHLFAIDQDILRAHAQTQEEAQPVQAKALKEIMYLLWSRPAPRNTVGDVIHLSLTSGLVVGGGGMPFPISEDMTYDDIAKQVESLKDEPVDFLGGLGLIRRVLLDTVELLQAWRDRGVNQDAINRALITRMQQFGMTRVPDDRKTGPSSWHGGWA